MQQATIETLAEEAKAVRREIITMIGRSKSGHPGGSLSATDIVTALYAKVMRHRPNEPDWPDRDRFILSKGHAAPCLYAVLARNGYFPIEQLKTLRTFGSPLQGHPEKGRLPGVEASTGSLGQGISIGAGMALSGRLDEKDFRVIVLIGDGEANEGQIWEAAMFAAHYKLNRLTVVLDCNRQQLDGFTTDILDIRPYSEKWRAFGWHLIEIDGHDLSQIVAAFDEADKVVDQPTLILAHTIKGKGVSFMEDNPKFHGEAPTAEQVEIALKELA